MNEVDLLMRDDYNLFLINSKPSNPALAIRKLCPLDLVYKVYKKAN